MLSHYAFDEDTLKPDLDSHLLAEVFHSYKNGYGNYAYMELPLIGSKRYQNFKDKLIDHPEVFNRMLPQIKLVNIILGYQYTSNAWLEIQKAIEFNAAKHADLNFRITTSKFSDHG